MSTNTTRRRRAAAGMVAGSLAMLVALAGVPSPAAAGDGGDDESVASDGSAPAALAENRPTFSPSASGTGEQSPADATEEDRTRVAPAAPPSDGPSGESIIGPDDRTRIRNTTRFPSRAIAFVTSDIGQCTGFMISEDTVATAGHCVHWGSGGGFARRVTVQPGRNKDALPFGTCRSVRLYTSRAWAKRSDPDHDYAAIKLDCRVGRRTGWIGLFWLGHSLDGFKSKITGYPADKSPYATMWKSVDRIRATRQHKLYYGNDTFGGMSGSPVYFNRSSCGVCAMAVHAYGVGGSRRIDRFNSGTRITREVFDNYMRWKDA